MKKILALALVLAMMLTMFSFVTSAADATPEGTAIDSEDDLKSLEAGKTYYLANDITLSGTETIMIPNGVTIIGNGNGFLKSGEITTPLFSFETIKVTEPVLDEQGNPTFDEVLGVEITKEVIKDYTKPTTFQDIYFGKAGAAMQLATTDVYNGDYSMSAPVFEQPHGTVQINWTNVDFNLGATNSEVGYLNTLFWNATGTQTYTNCDLNLNIVGAKGEFGGIGLNASGAITMTNCTVNGSINTTKTAGSFFKEVSSGSLIMTNCVNNAVINAGGIAGGFFSSVRAADLQIYNCENTANLVLGSHGGSLAGNAQKAGKIYIDGFVNSAATLKAINHVGGIFGQLASTKVDGHMNTIKNVTNNADVIPTGTGGYTGGIIGDNGKTPFIMENVVNNGDVIGTSRHIGGFIGRNASDNGSSDYLDDVQLFKNCVNNGNVDKTGNKGSYELAGFVALPAGATSSHVLRLQFENCVNNGNIGSTTNKANYRTAAGFVGCTDFVSVHNKATMTFINCANNGDMVGGTLGAGGFVGYSQDSMYFESCVNTGDITNAASGTGGFCGFTSWRANASNILSGTADRLTAMGVKTGTGVKAVNCINTGAINGSATPNGGLFGRINSAVTVVIDNSVNYGNVSGGNDAAGMLANHQGGALTVTNCVNYGNISGSQIVGGIVGWKVAGASTVTNCVNYGDVKGCHGVGGIMGEIVSGKITNCLNAGNIGPYSSNAEGIGGIVGIFRTVTNSITIENVANIGTVTGTTKANASHGCFAEGVGQFIGRVGGGSNGNDPWIKDSGIVDGVFGYDDGDAIAPDSIKLINALGYGVAQINPDAQWAPSEVTYTPSVGADGKLVTAYVMAAGGDTNDIKPVLRNNGAFGDNVKVASTSIYDLNADLNKLEAMGFKANFKLVDGKIVVDNAATLKGFQMSADKTAIRFAATLDSADIDAAGFEYSLTYNGQVLVTDANVTATNLLYAVKANGGLKTELAAVNGGKLFNTITFENVPATGTLEITVQATVNGVATGAKATVSITNGVATIK